jgi:hypothetical protein
MHEVYYHPKQQWHCHCFNQNCRTVSYGTSPNYFTVAVFRIILAVFESVDNNHSPPLLDKVLTMLEVIRVTLS